MKILKYKGIDYVFKGKDSFALLVAQFEDEDGNNYQWAPKWNELSELFTYAPATEELNDGGQWFELVCASLSTIAMVVNNFSRHGKKLKLPPRGHIDKGPCIKINVINESESRDS